MRKYLSAADDSVSLFDPLQWIFIAMAVLFILSVIAGILLRFFRALTGEMPVNEKEKEAGRALGRENTESIARRMP